MVWCLVNPRDDFTFTLMGTLFPGQQNR